jgi:hypothetical protein
MLGLWIGTTNLFHILYCKRLRPLLPDIHWRTSTGVYGMARPTPFEGCLHAYLSVGAKDRSHLIYKLYSGALIGQERRQRSKRKKIKQSSELHVT